MSLKFHDRDRLIQFHSQELLFLSNAVTAEKETPWSGEIINEKQIIVTR